MPPSEKFNHRVNHCRLIDSSLQTLHIPWKFRFAIFHPSKTSK